MNVNIKLSLTDEQRNQLKRKITGKDVKAMISRKEVCELVNDYISSLLSGSVAADSESDSTFTEGHDECCRANRALLTRINRLQHKLDTITR